VGLKSHTTVLDYWKKWMTLGIVEPIRVRGGTRYKRSFSLLDFGIEVPKTKVEEVEAKEVSETPKEEQEGSG